MRRILALDGGGVHAGIMARALGEIYGMDEPGPDIIRRFAYVAANSGGSVVMAGLCGGFTPRELVALYDDPATQRRIFSPKWTYYLPGARRLQLIPRESSAQKRAALTAIFDRKSLPGGVCPSTVPLTDWPRVLGCDVNLVVVAFDYDGERASFFRSKPSSLAASSTPANPATLIDAVHASTNAPISYFDAPAIVNGRRYWDGALAGYNNPAFCAVVEALANEPDRIDDFRVLSLGSHASALPIDAGIAKPWGRSRDGTGMGVMLRKVTQVILDDPPDAASFHAHVALRQRLPRPGETVADGNVVRLCPFLAPRWDGTRWRPLDGVKDAQFQAMLDAPVDAFTEDAMRAIGATGRLWIDGVVRNQPIRAGDNLRCDIGHETFAAGRAHWLAIS